MTAMDQDMAAVLLAGGLGRRMRQDGAVADKPLRALAGQSLLAHTIARIRPQVGAMAINANGDPARFADFGVDVIADDVPDYPGPLAGILAGMRWAAARGCADVLSGPPDPPVLRSDLVVRLQAARAQAGVPLACAGSGGWRHPVVGLWTVALADALEADLRAGMRKIGQWTAQYGVAVAEFEIGRVDPFLNINTPDELTMAERAWARLADDQG